MSGTEDFLVEVGTEELPPKALRNLMNSFAAGIESGLEKARLGHGEVKAFASPRRLAVVVSNLDAGQKDQDTVQKGPPIAIAFDNKGEPTKAALAFAKKCGVDINELGREKNAGGEWLVHKAVQAGQVAATLLPGIVQQALDSLPVPRRMRWGDHDDEFVRPVHWLIMLHGSTVVPGAVLGIESGNQTCGHRFHTSGKIEIGAPGEYATTLESAGYVLADFADRREKIVAAVFAAAKKAGGEPVCDEALFDEVTALTEWPVPLTGTFDKEFLALPKEVIIATLTSHQRYFPVASKKGDLLPVFITLANIESKQPGRVRDGNERVIRPRLADAVFFWQTDQQVALGERTDALKKVVYQKGLGSLHDKSMRVAALASLFAEQVGADAASVTRAAVLAKCDLLTGLVGEFPELQGTMGAYYAAAGGEPADVAQAIGEQYLPRFAGDALPNSIAGQILAVADKLDTLAGIFVLGKKPSGNRDPFGLRRAALGVVRILIEKDLDLDFNEAIKAAIVQQPASGEEQGATRDALHAFISERLKRYFLDSGEGFSADMFEAVRARRPASLQDFRQRLRAVAAFIELEPAIALAAANKRTANILRQANYVAGDGALDSAGLTDAAERVLFHALQSAQNDVAPLLEKRAYADTLRRLAELRTPVDAFFDNVMVMSDDEALKNNRLALLAELRALFLNVADISRLTPAGE